MLAARLDAASRAGLGRSLAVFVVVAGDCGGCALEWAMVRGLAGHGVSIVEHPAAADVLLAMGAMTRSLVAAVQRAWAVMGAPKWVVAVGDCAIDGGLFAASGAVAGGVGAAVPIDLAIPGCPPSPPAIRSALRTLLAANTHGTVGPTPRIGA